MNSILFATVLVFAFISVNGAVIDSPESHSVENGTSNESNEVPVVAQRFQRAASISVESVENNSTESLESDEVAAVPLKAEPRGCNVTTNLNGVPTELVCDLWTGGRKGAPFVKECDCNWGTFHNCLCVVKSGWTMCLKDCKQLPKTHLPEAGPIRRL